MDEVLDTGPVKPRRTWESQQNKFSEYEFEILQKFAVEILLSTGSFVLATEAAATLGVKVETLSLWQAMDWGPNAKVMFGRYFYDTENLHWYRHNERYPPEEIEVIV